MASIRFAVFLGLPIVAFVAPVVACGTQVAAAVDDDALDAGSVESDANADHVEVSPYPPAKGDPCRGQPLPEDQHFVPEGFCARLVSVATPGIRQISFASNGDMFGQTIGGAIFLFRDEDGDGFYTKDEIHAWASSGGNGNNAHVDEEGGYVYAGSNDGVVRFAYDPSSLQGGELEDVVVGQPRVGHTRHTTHVFDGFLYVHSGSAGNATHESGEGQQEYDTKRSLIKRFDLSKFTPGTPFSWDSGEVYTRGLRNVNGFNRSATTGKIYGVVNGLDGQQYGGVSVRNDNPGEQVVEITSGKAYGYPFCFTAQRIVKEGELVEPGAQLANPSYGGNPHDDAWCAANSDKPVTFLQAHTAPLDLVFFDQQPSGVLPERWRGGAFIALHGSWDRSPATGYKVIWQPFEADGSAPMPTSTKDTTDFPYEVVFGGGTVEGGHEDKAWAWSDDSTGEAPRPAGVAVHPSDGALYLSSDASGFIYRVGLRK